jgi:outer membrane protein assembly factor BamB
MPSRRSVTRRDVLQAGGALSLCATAGCLSTDRDEAAREADGDPSWRSFGHDAANTNYAPDGRAPTEGARERWRLDGASLTAQAAVVDGVVYAPVGPTVRAVDATSGETLWSTDPDENAGVHWATPTVGDGVVYVGDGDERVRAFGASSGELLWGRTLDGGVYGSPTVGFGGRDLFVGTAGETLYCLDAATGETKWDREVFGGVPTAPAAAAEGVYVAARSGEVYSFTSGGRGRWRTALPRTTECAPVLVGDSLYVGCHDGSVYALETFGGARRWSAAVGGFAKHVAAAAGLVFADADRGVVALDAGDGRTRWRLRVGTGDANPIAVGDTVYAGGEKLTAARLRGGVSLGAIRLGARRFARPFGDGGVRHLSGGGGLLVASLRTGEGDAAVVAFEEG